MWIVVYLSAIIFNLFIFHLINNDNFNCHNLL